MTPLSIDVAELRDRFLIEDDREAVEMLTAFLSSSQDLLSELEDAVRRGDRFSVRDRAHAARGAAANASAGMLTKLFATLEQIADKADWSDINALASDARIALSDVRRFVGNLACEEEAR